MFNSFIVEYITGEKQEIILLGENHKILNKSNYRFIIDKIEKNENLEILIEAPYINNLTKEKQDIYIDSWYKQLNLENESSLKKILIKYKNFIYPHLFNHPNIPVKFQAIDIRAIALNVNIEQIYIIDKIIKFINNIKREIKKKKIIKSKASEKIKLYLSKNFDETNKANKYFLSKPLLFNNKLKFSKLELISFIYNQYYKNEPIENIINSQIKKNSIFDQFNLSNKTNLQTLAIEFIQSKLIDRYKYHNIEELPLIYQLIIISQNIRFYIGSYLLDLYMILKILELKNKKKIIIYTGLKHTTNISNFFKFVSTTKEIKSIIYN